MRSFAIERGNGPATQQVGLKSDCLSNTMEFDTPLNESFKGVRFPAERKIVAMQIDFSTSGGVANIELTYRAETASLPEAQARELESLVESSGAFDLDQDDLNINATVCRADVISYRLTLSEGSKQTTLWMNDVTAPASVRPLLSHLRKLAIEQRKQG